MSAEQEKNRVVSAGGFVPWSSPSPTLPQQAVVAMAMSRGAAGPRTHLVGVVIGRSSPVALSQGEPRGQLTAGKLIERAGDVLGFWVTVAIVGECARSVEIERKASISEARTNECV